MADALPEGLVALSPGGRVVAWNHAAATLLGLAHDAAPATLADWPELAAAAVREPPHALTLPGGTVHVEARALDGGGEVATGWCSPASYARRCSRAAPRGPGARWGSPTSSAPVPRCAAWCAPPSSPRASDPLLVAGEPGSGRRLLARAVHGGSTRAAAPLVTVDCGGAPRHAAAEELFGAGGRPGLVDIVADGALLLVEVADLPLDAQARLAAFIAERRGPRIYATTTVVVYEGARRPLGRELARVLRPGAIGMPPLRERSGDFEALVEHILPRLSAALGKVVTSMAPEVLEVLAGYPWPGNVRELEEVLEQEVHAAGPDEDSALRRAGGARRRRPRRGRGPARARCSRSSTSCCWRR